MKPASLRKQVFGLFVLIYAAGASLVLAGCGTGKTMVMEPGESRKASSIAVVEGQSTVTVPAEATAMFKNKLDEMLFEKGGIKKGQDVTLTYRFVQFNEGSRFKRWLTGGIGNAGEGNLTIEVTYSDGSGKQLGKIVSEGKIGSGFFGGSSDNAIEKAAEEVASYTVDHYK
jgi:uncharacterized protein DUF4410